MPKPRKGWDGRQSPALRCPDCHKWEVYHGYDWGNTNGPNSVGSLLYRNYWRCHACGWYAYSRKVSARDKRENDRLLTANALSFHRRMPYWYLNWLKGLYLWWRP